MTYKYEKGQRVFCEREAQYGVLTSDARFTVSDFRPGLTPPHDRKAIPKYDVRFENGSLVTIPETELKPALRLDPECTAVQLKTDRWATASAWAEKHKALLGLLIAILAAGLTAAKLFMP